MERVMNLSPIIRSLKKICLVLVATLVPVLIVELTLRKFFPRYYPVIAAAYEYDADLAFRLRPNAHLFEVTDFQEESMCNRLGTANFQENFDGYQSLIFAVGDSYTEGTGLPADMSYPSQLDLMLNQDERGFYVKKVGVVNLGVAGYGEEQELVSLQRWTKLLGPPSVILLIGCDNDFDDDEAFRSGARHRGVLAGSPVWGRLTTPLRLLLENSQIGFRMRAALSEHEGLRLTGKATERINKSASVAELESSMLERIASFAGEHGSRLVVSWSDEGNSYNWLKSWAARSGIAFADWVPKVDSVRSAIPSLPLDNQHSGGHHRGWTNRVMAEEFMRQIKARNP
jgi:lysophospholipase L1-like esterase